MGTTLRQAGSDDAPALAEPASVTVPLRRTAGRGARQAWLGVNSENFRARGFFERHGFRVAGSKDFQWGNRVDHDHVMVLPVQS
jgi:hypothetical protein